MQPNFSVQAIGKSMVSHVFLGAFKMRAISVSLMVFRIILDLLLP